MSNPYNERELIEQISKDREWQGLTDTEKTYYANFSYTSKVNLIDEIERALKKKNT